MNEARHSQGREREELDRSFVVKAGGGGDGGEEDGGAVRHGGLASRGLAAERA